MTGLILEGQGNNYPGERERKDPTDPFTNLEFENPLHDVFEQPKFSRSSELEVLNLLKGRSGRLGQVVTE